VALVTVALCTAAPATATAWRPHVHSAAEYAAARAGHVSFGVRTARGLRGVGVERTVPSASVVKAMLLVAFLREHAAHRALTGDERGTLEPMIERSDNNAANRVYGWVGDGGLYALAHAARMRHFRSGGPYWGYSLIDAQDQARYFLHIDRLVPARHRHYAMHLLASVIPEQRWGVGQVRPPGWRLYFKGGWGSGSGLTDHQIALLRRGGRRVAVAVLTRNDPSHEYGKRTLQGTFGRLLRSLSKSRFVP
jgi:beta-lactamase class A